MHLDPSILENKIYKHKKLPEDTTKKNTTTCYTCVLNILPKREQVIFFLNYSTQVQTRFPTLGILECRYLQ